MFIALTVIVGFPAGLSHAYVSSQPQNKVPDTGLSGQSSTGWSEQAPLSFLPYTVAAFP